MPLTRAILEGENPWTIAKIANTMNAVAFIAKGVLDFYRIEKKTRTKGLQKKMDQGINGSTSIFHGNQKKKIVG